MVPIAGGPAAEVFGAVIQPALEGRKERWFELLHEDMLEVEQKLEDMPNRDEFTTIVIQASQIALRTHQEEKLKLLRNAVRNTARQLSPKGDLPSIFLNLLDGLTPSHVGVLIKFDGRSYNYKPVEPPSPPKDDEEENDDNSGTKLINHVPKTIYVQDKALKPRRSSWSWLNQSEDMFTQIARKIASPEDHELVRQLLKDLVSRGLLEEKAAEPFIFSRLNGETSSLNLSKFGVEFLRFIHD